MAASEHQKRAQRQELRTAADTSGVRNTGSGNTLAHGNDVRTPIWSVENKTTTADSYRVSLRVWQAVLRNALLDGREPVLQVDIAGVRLAVVDWNYLLELARREE